MASGKRLIRRSISKKTTFYLCSTISIPLTVIFVLYTFQVIGRPTFLTENQHERQLEISLSSFKTQFDTVLDQLSVLGKKHHEISKSLSEASTTSLNRVYRNQANLKFGSWVRYLQESNEQNKIVSKRSICREFDANAQTCLFEGLSCIDRNSSQVYLIDDNEKDLSIVSSDDWCSLRHFSADPKYFSSRHWPLLTNTMVPQRSCMKAKYSSLKSFVSLSQNLIKWVPYLSLVNLDYAQDSHNNHLLKDIIWLLDISLFQDSLNGKLQRYTPSSSSSEEKPDPINMFKPYERIYLPQTRQQFEKQTSKDLNRLTYSLILRKPLEELYKSSVDETAVKLFDAFPELNEQLIFKNDSDTNSKFICTSNLLVGAKIGDGAHERVCRYMRSVSFKAYGVFRPRIVHLGQIRYPRPQRSVLIIDRHSTRKIGNLKAVKQQLFKKLNDIDVEVNYISTKDLKTAQDYVRYYSSAGIILSPHGSHNMGMIWMQRYSAFIEIMPAGYTDYAFNLLTQSCRIWHYELPSMVPKNATAKYEKLCKDKVPHMMDPCMDVKYKDVWVNVTAAYNMIVFALERLGHNTKTWLNDQVDLDENRYRK